MKSRLMLSQLSWSMMVGISGTGILCLIMYIVTDLFGRRYLESFAYASVPYFLWCFLWHKFKVFKDLNKEEMHWQVIKYAVMKAALAIVNWAMLYKIVSYFNIEEHYILAQASIAVLLFFAGFIIARQKIFTNN